MVAKSTLRDKRRLGFYIIENGIFDAGIAAKIGPYAFTTYSYLVRLAGKDDSCYPKIEVICEVTGVSKPTVIRSINKLIEQGLISKTRTKTTNHYVIEDHLQSKRRSLSGETQSQRQTPTESTSDTPPLTIQRHNNKDTPDDDVDAVFNHWKKTLKHPRATLDKKRRDKIARTLKDYSPDDIAKAVVGCSLSPYHMGDNDSGTKYDDLTLIIRDAEHIERFIGFADRPPKPRQQAYSPQNETRPRKPLT